MGKQKHTPKYQDSSGKAVTKVSKSEAKGKSVAKVEQKGSVKVTTYTDDTFTVD